VLISRRIAALIVAAALGVPATAAAQTTTTPRGKADVSTTPPVPLPDGNASGGGSQAAAGNQLPNTGSDPRVLFLCGVALTLLGVGLRLRTADAELY
jgi:hypothetical protein